MQKTGTPKEIKEWLASDGAVYSLVEINEKLGLKGEKRPTIARLIKDLLSKDVDAMNFINELSHRLNISFENAKSITMDVERSVLRPIEHQLKRDLDIDIKLFYFGKPGPQEQKVISPQELPELKSSPSIPQQKPIAQNQGPVVDLQSFRIKSDRPLSPLTFASGISSKSIPEPKKEAPQETHPTPFMLHQENPTSTPSINPQGQIPQAAKSSLTMKVQNFYQSQASTSPSVEKTVPKPISIKFETSDYGNQKISTPIPVSKQDAPPTPKSEKPDLLPNITDSNTRVVHYSNLRTPLTTVGTPKNSIEKDNVLDLRKIIK